MRLRTQMMPVPLPAEVGHPMFRGEKKRPLRLSKHVWAESIGSPPHAAFSEHAQCHLSSALPNSKVASSGESGWSTWADILNNQLKGRPLDRDRPKADPVTGHLPTLSPSPVTVPAMLGRLLTRPRLSVRFGQAVRSTGSWGRVSREMEAGMVLESRPAWPLLDAQWAGERGPPGTSGGWKLRFWSWADLEPSSVSVLAEISAEPFKFSEPWFLY